MSRFVSLLARLHRDEQGAEKVEYLLILAAVALPLLGIIIIYRDKRGTFTRSVTITFIVSVVIMLLVKGQTTIAAPFCLFK